MNKIGNFIKFFERNSNQRNITIGVVFILFVNIVVFPIFPKLFFQVEIPLNEILDVHFGFTTDYVQQFFTSIETEGRKAYLLSTGLVDTPYAMIYGFVYAIILIFIIKNKMYSGRLRYLILLPFLISLFDLVENTGIIYLVSTYPESNDMVVSIASFANQLKWIFAGITLFTLFVILVIPKSNKINSL
jgi:hypothetical protein